MTISAISSASSYPYSTTQNAARQSFTQLVSALQSGDLSAAQNAYATFTQNAGSQLDANSPFAQAINQIGQDLQSGNIGGAQQTLNSLQQSAGAHHAHHHHGGGGGISQALDSSATSTSTPGDPTTLSSALSLSSSNIVDVSA
jgi:hypothetical protein